MSTLEALICKIIKEGKKLMGGSDESKYDFDDESRDSSH